jgi:hypothetical protein
MCVGRSGPNDVRASRLVRGWQSGSFRIERPHDHPVGAYVEEARWLPLDHMEKETARLSQDAATSVAHPACLTAGDKEVLSMNTWLL